MADKIEYIVNLDDLEDQCIALRIHANIVFCYPWSEAVGKYNPKVLTREGKLVKHITPATKDGERIITGELDGERLVWNINGKFIGEDPDGNLSLFVPERYFVKNWKSTIKMTNGEWILKYGRKHPNVKIADKWEEKARRKYEG